MTKEKVQEEEEEKEEEEDDGREEDEEEQQQNRLCLTGKKRFLVFFAWHFENLLCGVRTGVSL